MRVIAKRTLRKFWTGHPAAEEPLLAWFREVQKEDWDTPAKVKSKYRTASVIGGNRVVFNIKGNHYRLLVEVHFPEPGVLLKFRGSPPQDGQNPCEKGWQ